MAMYRSQVNEVIVRIVALVDVSESSPCRIQTISSNGYELGSQMFMKSKGIPISNNDGPENKNIFVNSLFFCEKFCLHNYFFFLCLHLALDDILYKHWSRSCIDIIVQYSNNAKSVCS